MTKYGVQVKASSSKAGYGMFAARDLPAGTDVPVKGPWFATTKEAVAFLTSLPRATGESFAKRVVEVITTSPEPGWTSHVLTKSTAGKLNVMFPSRTIFVSCLAVVACVQAPCCDL